MPINWNLMDTQYPSKLADLFNPQSVQARQSEISNRDTADQLRQMQVMQAAQQMRRAPELQRREDLNFQVQQQEAARKQAVMGVLRDPKATPEQRKQALFELFPEKAAEQEFKAPAVRDFNQPFLPTGEPNKAYQQWKLAEQRAGKSDAAPKLQYDSNAASFVEPPSAQNNWTPRVIPVQGMKPKSVGKPLPAPALKMQQEELDAIGTATALNSDLSAFGKMIDEGKLNLGLTENITGQARNYLGASTEQSRNLASFTANLERLRNESLRLNKGVQTEGDAVRAWNEIVKNINDPKLVKQRLEEVQKVNERAVLLRKMQIDSIRSNYGHDPLDTSGRENLEPAYGSNSNAPDAAKEARYQAWKAQQGR